MSTCSAGDLVSVTDPMQNVTTYTYDAGNADPSQTHDLLSITKPNGQSGEPHAGAAMTNVYDLSGRVVSQTDPGGWVTTFDYSHMDTDNGNGYTLVADPNGNVTQYQYTNSVLTKKVLAFGTTSPSTWTFTVDPSTMATTAVVDPNNNTTGYAYDDRGNLVKKTDPLGRMSTYSYNGFDEPVCAAAPLAAAGCGSLLPPAAVAAGASTVAPPSAAPPAFVRFSEYDTNGDLVWTSGGAYASGSSSPSEIRTSYRLYNGQTLDLSSSVSCAAAAPSGSLPCALVDPNGVSTQLGYDAAGDLSSSSTADGNAGGELATTSYGYDGDGERTSITAPNGNLSGATAAVYTTSYGYDSDGRVIEQTVGQTGGGVTARVTSYGYDGDGNRVSVTDPRGKLTSYEYTAADQLTLVTDPDGQKTLTCYDGEGRVAETVPPVGVAANSLSPGSCPTGYPAGYGSRLAADATSTSYDALGDPVTTTTPAPAGQSGYQTISRSYDPAGRLISVTAPPASNSPGAASETTQYGYDAAGELTSKTVGALTAAASTTVYCYDPDGNRTATVAPDGNTGSLASCATGSPWQTSSGFQTGYSYDSLGQLVSTTRPATAASPGGQTSTYSYDAAGNQTASTDANGVTVTTSYTPLDQPATVSYSGGAAHAVSYGYDANGNRTSMSDGSGSSSYQYDPFDELTSQTNGAGQTVSYGYDADGNTTSIGYPLGGPSWASSSSIGYGYDDAGELTTVTDFGGHTVTVANNADGLPTSLGLGASGDTITTNYDQTDRPSQISLENGSSTLLGFSYSNTPAGTISEETLTPSGSASPRDYSYDAQGRLTQMTVAGGTPAGYSFDASGNATTLPSGAAASYDNASELTSSTLAGTTTSYSYTAAGERSQTTANSLPQTTASYNGAHELTSYTTATGSLSAATYDGDGLRTATTNAIAGGGPTSQSYLWDTTSGSLPRLLMDSTNAYVYGPGQTPIEQINLATGATSYLLADRLGSVRAVITAAGAISETTNYDAWGTPDRTGGLTDTTPFGYAGSYTDPTGLLYLTHRYYDPQTGQFLTLDPAVDQTEAPYAYVNGDPVDGVDPLGLGCFLGIACGAQHAVATGWNTINPLSRSDVFRGIASAGGTGASILQWNPLLPAARDFINAGSECSFSASLADVLGGLGWTALSAIAPEDDEAVLAAEEEGTTLFRAVEPGELSDIQASGAYRVPEGIGGGKYFYPTQEQAANFARLNPGRSYTLTSSQFPEDVFGASWHDTIGGEGPAHFIPREFFPHGPVNVGGPLP